VRQQFQQHDMPVDEAPEDDEIRETYNFAPGYHGLVYRADVPYYGAGERHHEQAGDENESLPHKNAENRTESSETKYKLQAMKWGK